MARRQVRVSVIMACHNSAAYLDEGVRSVLAQTLSDLELILIDDGSTDNTLEIARRYAHLDRRVVLLTLPVRSGPAVARNAGIQAARGEWIGILDSDDVAIPIRFAAQLEVADRDQQLVMIGSNSVSIDERGHVIQAHLFPTNHHRLATRLSRLRAFPPHSSRLYRRTSVQQLAAFDPRYVPSEDADLCLRLSEVGKLSCVDKPLVRIRIHPQNISNWEGGSLQIRMAVIASVCHLLRAQGSEDPSASADEASWRDFVGWAHGRMKQDGLFERRSVWAKARAEYLATKAGVTRTVRYAGRLLLSGRASELAWEKFFGSRLPARLAREWTLRSQDGR